MSDPELCEYAYIQNNVLQVGHMHTHSLCSQLHIREDLDKFIVISTNTAVMMNDSSHRINIKLFSKTDGNFRKDWFGKMYLFLQNNS